MVKTIPGQSSQRQRNGVRGVLESHRETADEAEMGRHRQEWRHWQTERCLVAMEFREEVSKRHLVLMREGTQRNLRGDRTLECGEKTRSHIDSKVHTVIASSRASEKISNEFLKQSIIELLELKDLDQFVRCKGCRMEASYRCVLLRKCSKVLCQTSQNKANKKSLSVTNYLTPIIYRIRNQTLSVSNEWSSWILGFIFCND